MRSIAAALLLLAAAALPAHAAVRVIAGPTPIEGGDARAAGDLTIVNDRLAFALAVESPVPYGVPRGALVDIAAVKGGRIGRDHAVIADFIPNNWSAWPNTYQRVKVLEKGPRRAVVEAVRDWGDVTIRTRYTLRDGADRVEIATTMVNGGKAALPDLLSGYVLWPRGGFLFGVPGAAEQGPLPAGAPPRTVAYDEDFMVALHAPYMNRIEYGSKDLYLRHTLKAGETRRFTGFVQVGADGDLAPVIAAEGRRAGGTLAGKIDAADGAVIVVERDGVPYGWTLSRAGAYSLPLPAGEYTAYATAKGHADSERSTVAVRTGARATHDFPALAGPGNILLNVADEAGPLDARIAVVRGRQPLVGFLGRKTFFTEFEARGVAKLSLAPGDYTLRITHGGGFTHDARELDVTVAPGADLTETVRLTRFADPAAQGWYGADLHHHADQAEAVTPPPDLARAQLAAGLDLLFVSDHDTMVNLPAVTALGRQRGVPVLGSMEFSASWAHFNAYPLALDGELRIDMGTAPVDAIFAEARRLGASVIQVNHPYIPYGYFASAAAGTAPGGWNDGFDVAEINGATPGDDGKVLAKLWADWNAGLPHYLAGGTDLHDVWAHASGSTRTFVHLDGPPTAQAYAAALKAGRAYVSGGPLVFPDTVFGTRLAVAAGAPVTLGYRLQSAAGIRKVELVADGAIADSRSPADLPRELRVSFERVARKSGWYALMVEDGAGRKAYTDPVWVDVR